MLGERDSGVVKVRARSSASVSGQLPAKGRDCLAGSQATGAVDFDQSLDPVLGFLLRQRAPVPGTAVLRSVQLGQDSSLQRPDHLRFRGPSAPLHLHVECVEKRVQGRVERQHEDGDADVDLVGDGHSHGGQQPEQTDGEPAEEVGEDDGGQSAGDGDVSGLPGGVGGDGVVAHGQEDEHLAHGYQDEQDQVQNAHDGEGILPAVHDVPGDGQRDADARLAVETPVVGHRQQWNRGQSEAHGPGYPACDLGRLPSEANGRERIAKNEETVKRDEADYESGHLAGQQRQAAGDLTKHAALPRLVVPDVVAVVQPVCSADDDQVYAHQKVGHAEVGDKDVKAYLRRTFLAAESVHKAAQVAQDGHGGEDPQEEPVHVGTQQLLTRRDLVGRSETFVEVKVVWKGGFAAEFIVLGIHGPQTMQSFYHSLGKLGEGNVSHVQHFEMRSF